MKFIIDGGKAMGINLLKQLNGKTPDLIKRLGAPLIRNKLIKNHTFLDQISELEKFEKLSDEEKRKIQITIREFNIKV